MNIEFIYASPLSYLHYRQARKAVAKGKYVVLAINAPTSQSRKAVIASQQPKWVRGSLGFRVMKMLHGGITNKADFEASYRRNLSPSDEVYSWCRLKL